MEHKFQPQQRTFAIWETIGEAWELIGGSKWPIWAIAILIFVAFVVVQTIILFIFGIDLQNPPVLYAYLIMQCITNIVIAPFVGGATMLGIKRARGETITPRSGYHYFHKTIPLMITLLIIAVLANIINYIVHLPAIVIAVGLHTGWLDLIANIIFLLVYTFLLLSVPLVIDKNLPPLTALKMSFEIIKHCWFKVLVLIIIVWLFFIIAAIPFFVGSMIHPYARLLGWVIFIIALVWLIPLLSLITGILYHKLVD